MAKSHVKWASGAGNGMTRPMTVGKKRVKVKRVRTTYEVFQGKDRKGSKKIRYDPALWYFHLVAGNGEIIASSEGYTRRFTAEQGAKRVLASQ